MCIKSPAAGIAAGKSAAKRLLGEVVEATCTTRAGKGGPGGTTWPPAASMGEERRPQSGAGLFSA